MKPLILLFALSFCLSCHKKGAEGSAMLYTNTASHGQITVEIDSKPVGTITQYYSGTPGCNAAGCITLDLAKGTHAIRAQSATGKVWETTITISPGKCSPFALN